jgi:hypothetical protein
MGHSKISATIPDETYQDIKLFSLKMNMKVSHFVAAALAEKLKKIKADAFVAKVNEVYGDPDVSKEQYVTAELIASTTNVEEVPW